MDGMLMIGKCGYEACFIHWFIAELYIGHCHRLVEYMTEALLVKFSVSITTHCNLQMLPHLMATTMYDRIFIRIGGVP